MYIINTVTFSLGYSLILLGLSQSRSLLTFLKLFFLCLFMYVCFMHLNLEDYLTLPLSFLVTTIQINKYEKYKWSLFNSLTAMLILVIYILMVGNIFFIIDQHIMETLIFNIYMGVMCISFSACFYIITINKSLLKQFYNSKNLIYICIIIEIILLIFISFILPLAINSEDKNYIFFSYYFLFIVCIIVVSCLVYFLTLSETEIRYRKLKLKASEVNGKIIEEKYNEIFSLKHYYNKLYEMMYNFINDENWEELKIYFDKYIIKIHEKHIFKDLNITKLELIKIPLIKNLLLDTIIKCEHIYKIQLSIQITNVIYDTSIDELDLFIILNEWISNAIYTVKDQDFIHILICNENGCLSFQVTNPINEKVNISMINNKGYTTKIGHAGLGLYNVRQIISSYENIEHMNYIELDKFIQCLVIWRK